MRVPTLLIALLAGLTIIAPAHAEDARNVFPQQYSMSPKGVNLQTGRFHYSKTDISIGDLKFVRNWGNVPSVTSNSRSIGGLSTYLTDVQPGWTPTNLGWSHNFNEGVVHVAGGNTTYAHAYVVVGGKIYTMAILADGTPIPAEQSSNGTMLNGSADSTQWVFTDQNGAIYTFYAHPALVQPNGSTPNQLLQSVVYPDGSRTDYSYNAAGQPRFIKSSRGYAITIDYNGSGTVSAACGFNLAQNYADASSTCASSNLKVSYGYDGSGNLSSVTDTLGHVVTMTYVTTTSNFRYLNCISLANSPTCEITNVYGQQPGDGPSDTFDDQVRIQTTATGAVWRYSYRPPPDPADQPPVAGQPRYSISRMTDPSGGSYFLKYDRGHLTLQTTPSATINTRYRYHQVSLGYAYQPTIYAFHDTLPGLTTSPEGMEYFAHDNRGNLTAHAYWPTGSPNAAALSDPNLVDCCISPNPPTYPPGTVSYTQTFLGDYGAFSTLGFLHVVGCANGPPDAKLCNKPLSRTDANGNVTDYSYDQATGNLLTETAPVVNGVRAQTRNTYMLRYAWVKTAGGGYTQAATPVSLLVQTSFCKSGAAAGAGCAVAGDEVRTTYDYGPDSGPNNLLLRGIVNDTTGAALRTCYTYDWQGNKISETKPRAGLTVCP